MDSENDLPNYDSGALNSFIRSLGDFGWLQGNQFVDGKLLRVNYSSSGHQNMKLLAMKLKECVPVWFDAPFEKQSSRDLSFHSNEAGFKLFLIKASLLFPDLFLRIKAGSECMAIVALIRVYAMEYMG